MIALKKPSLVRAAIIAVGLAFATLPARAAEQEVKVAIPDTADGIWHAVDQHMAELRAVVAAGKLGEVHMHAFAVRDLVRALPDHSPNLAAAALATVKTEIQFVDTLAGRLDQTGDAGDKTGTEANLTKFETNLKSLRSQYENVR